MSIFSDKNIQAPFSEWTTNTITDIHTQAAVLQALEHGPYGRCVYQCDNDVVDHMGMAMEFENGVTAVINLSAFTNETCRTIKIIDSMGEIRGHMESDSIQVYKFGTAAHGIATEEHHPMKDLANHNPISISGHVGGDKGIMEDFLALLQNNNAGTAKSTLSRSVESHVMAFAAEQSRLARTSIAIDDFVTQMNTL